MLKRWLAGTWLLRGGSGRLAPSLGIGAALSVLVAALLATGWLGALERAMLDRRLQLFQYDTPPPTDRVVHIDIGDQTLSRFGRWPWPRARLAGLVDELDRAGAEVIAFDVLFLERQSPRYLPGRVPVPLVNDSEFTSQPETRAKANPESAASGTDSSNSESGSTPAHPQIIEDDAILAAAFQRAGNVILPIARRHTSEALATADEGDGTGDTPLPASLRASTRSVPKAWAGVPDEPITRPIDRLGRAAGGTGFVDYRQSADGVVRTLGLWRKADGRLYPQLGLSVACRLMELPVSEARITEPATILPREDGDLRLPHLPIERASPPGRARVMLPWTDWVLAEPPGDRAEARAALVKQPRSVRGWQVLQIRRMRQHIDLAVLNLASALNMATDAEDYINTLRRLRTEPRPADDYKQLHEKRARLRDSIVETATMYRADFNRFDDLKPAERKLRDRLVEGLDQVRALRDRLAEAERELRQRVADKACFVGLPATGLSDVVPTPRSSATPGVRVHSAMTNAVLTEHFIRRSSLWLDIGLVMVIGAIGSLLAARLAPLPALLATLAVAGAFTVGNGLMLDVANRWFALAGPLVAAASAWSGITLFRLVTEQRIKARITRQFKSYVSQDLVDYLAQHPEQVYLAGQRREVSCLFVDLAGFTDTSEKLGPEQSVKLLNTVLGTVARQLMQHRALVNKFLGDGLMAFWGAPIENHQHERDACRGALAAAQAVRGIDSTELPVSTASLTLRIGITSGPVMVGDFGAPPDRSDYTVLGDSVNLASRLEAANKQLGTSILISNQTKTRAADAFLTRPVGRIIVVGRSEPEPVHELLATHEDASDEQRALAAATAEATRRTGVQIPLGP